MATEAATVDSGGVEQRVEPLASRAAERVGCELVSVHWLTESDGWVLRIVVDRDGGVDVASCAKVSRQLSAMLDVDDVVGPAYTLEVSSPGLDDELLVAADYRRFAGRPVRIQTAEPIAGRKVLRGCLKGIRRGAVVLDQGDGEVLEIAREQIVEARLEVEI